jgi:hypothetical protein
VRVVPVASIGAAASRGRRTRRIDPPLPPELEALPAAGLELAADVAAVRVDLAGVRLVRRSVVHTRAALTHHERHLSEVSRLELVQDVPSSATLPAHQILLGDEDRAGPLVAAGAAGQAIQARVAHAATAPAVPRALSRGARFSRRARGGGDAAFLPSSAVEWSVRRAMLASMTLAVARGGAEFFLWSSL